MPNLLLVMLGGAIGAALRYEVGRIALHRLDPGFPWGTLIVNLAGGLLMGALAGYMFSRHPPDRALWMFVAVGLLGGFTTFSAFSFDLFAMLEQGRIWIAAAYAVGSVVGALGLLFVGYWLARAAA
jgi:fluoride exporter